jgi:hypothetical protein
MGKTAVIRPAVELDAWVVMPKPIHGILVIRDTGVETPRRGVSTEWRPGILGAIINQCKSKGTIDVPIN